jgi:hypothetical protein
MRRGLAVGGCRSWVNRNPVEPAAGPAMSAMLRKRKKNQSIGGPQLLFVGLGMLWSAVALADIGDAPDRAGRIVGD